MTTPYFRLSPGRTGHGVPAHRTQDGVALAVALVILVVITLVGVLAIRRAQLQSRLSQNAEATVMARRTATNNLNALVYATTPFLQPTAGNGFNICWIFTGTGGTQVPTSVFTCNSPDSTLSTFASTLPSGEQPVSYFQAKRETPPTLPTATLRAATLSGVAYQFASFSVLSGYDASGNGNGLAEVDQSILQPVANVNGVTEQ